MKKLILVLTLIAGIIYLSANVIYTYKLEAPDIITENNVIKVKMAGAQSYGNPGAPNLPWFGSKLLLPIGEEAIDIQISLSGAKTFYLDKKVAPIQPPAILSKMDKIQKIEADPEIYNRSDSYPTQKHNGNNTQYLSGHPINFTAICPFDYNPMEDKLTFYSQITVTVVTGSSSKANEARRLLKQDVDIAERLTNTIDNPEAIPRYEERLVGYDYLIIYDQLKLTQWLLFKTLYEDRGFNVYMKPIQEIIAESTGIDTQEKIRNYITNFYSQQPLKYVLLAGDTDLIPHRGFYVNMGSEGEVDEDIPADMYYSCLDGNWNTDNDSYWGEPMETDLVPELSIGRYCYNSDEEIANFINKTSMYLNNPVIPEIKSAFFVGEYLWEGPTWGGDYMDEMIGGSSANG
ncbi:MAG TPA: C25 family cysteine peptidase, partial [Candidatus Syntrophosphaera thermopropionivorans]|nr:C25 family cysteine peptidase [Candidatus Syntrophosphaera thermopropionivorans]